MRNKPWSWDIGHSFCTRKIMGTRRQHGYPLNLANNTPSMWNHLRELGRRAEGHLLVLNSPQHLVAVALRCTTYFTLDLPRARASASSVTFAQSSGVSSYRIWTMVAVEGGATLMPCGGKTEEIGVASRWKTQRRVTGLLTGTAY